MMFQSRTLVRCLALGALSAAVLALAIDQCDAGRGGGRGGGGGASVVVAVALVAALA